MASKSGEGEAGDDFRRAREAYEILADPDARARHDAGQSTASGRATTILEVDLGG
jgi:DnaJ-class molecular chaperone